LDGTPARPLRRPAIPNGSLPEVSEKYTKLW
jgi:hypothetical protein